MGELKQVSADELLDCDGCGRAMNFETYQQHACKAYRTNKYRNPWEHKIAGANWQQSEYMKGELKARGSLVKPKFPWSGVVFIVALGAVLFYLLWRYG